MDRTARPTMPPIGDRIDLGAKDGGTLLANEFSLHVIAKVDKVDIKVDIIKEEIRAEIRQEPNHMGEVRDRKARAKARAMSPCRRPSHIPCHGRAIIQWRHQ